MQKRVIVTDEMFVVKNLFYFFKTGQVWHLVDDKQTYIIRGATIENQETEDISSEFYKHLRPSDMIRFWNTEPNMNQQNIWNETIRIYHEVDSYNRDEFSDGITYPDFTIPLTAVKKLYHFLLKNKFKFYNIKNET